MAGVPVPAYQQFQTDKRSSLKTEYKAIINTHPDAAPSMQQLFKVLCAIEDLASYTLVESEATIISSAEDNRESYCKALRGKTLFSELHGTYTMTLNDLKNVMKASTQTGQTKQGDGFKEVRSRKRHSTEEAARTQKKVALPASTEKVATKNFFAPLRTINMDTDASGTDSNSAEEALPGK
jgi:hypothetical protein